MIHRQRGAALALLVMALALVFASVLMTSMSRSQIQSKADKTTREALNAAREALIQSAIRINGSTSLTNTDRPGELVCPDRNLPGSDDEGKEGLGGLSNCTGNAQLIRRLPWKALGLSQYKDGYGEPLWYMVVPPFEAQPNTTALNSNTAPAANLRAFIEAGRIELGSAANPVIAVVFAPGPALAGQNRNTTTRQNSPSNYLESVAPPNAAMAFNNGNSNPVIPRVNGPIKDAAGNIILNDQLVVITRDDIMNRLAPNGIRYGVRPRAATEYPAAFAARGIPPACDIASPTHPPPITPMPSASDNFNWLGQNNWDAVLTYTSCSPIRLQ